MMSNANRKVLILSNHFITLYNFRKELIKQLIHCGHTVYISLPYSKDNKYFEDLGCKIIHTKVNRRGINPIKDLGLIKNYISIMTKVKPDIIFSYTIKPNIYGSIASNITRNKQVNNITGTGGTFLNKNFIASIAKLLYKVSVKKSYKVFFQNSEDKDLFIKHKMVGDNYELIPGSGVNLHKYKYSSFPKEGRVNFIFIGRIMELKGIDQYLEMATVIKKEYPNTNFYVAGFIEEDKYKEIIDDYDKKGIIEYVGYQNDIKSWIEKSHCTILPSHGGEGVPNVLLETSAIGRVCIASKVSGSKDVIDHGINGYLFDTRNSNDLIDKVKMFLRLNHNDKVNMGLQGRKKVERMFDRSIVINAYLKELSKKSA